MKIEKEEFPKIIEKYLTGVSAKQLANNYGVSKDTINRIIVKLHGRQVFRLSGGQHFEIIDGYMHGKKIKELADAFNVANGTITRVLQKAGVREKSQNGKHKGGFSEIEKENIINLYVNQNRGKDYIAKLHDRSDNCISYFLNKWGVKTISRSKISTTIRKVYGATKGFTGRSHSVDSKNQIANSMKQSWEQGDRQVTIGKSRMYDTIIGRVLGKFEVAYIQKCYELNEKLPEICHKRYKTPFGSYKPDFVKDGRFIEVKSKFTLRVAYGQYHNNKGKYSDKQWKKINYFMENIATLDLIVLDNKEAYGLFSRAKDILIKEQITL